MKKVCFILFLAVALGTPTVFSADWPQYLGPNGDATSAETGLAKTWPEEGPKVLWRVELGAGYGAAAVVDGKAYVLDRIGAEKDNMRCFDLETGKEEWSFSYDAPGRVGHPGSRSVPAVNDQYVFSIGPHGDLYCFDKATHKPVWNKNLGSDYGREPSLSWGYGQNPLLYNNVLYVAPMSDKVGVAALKPESGEIIWTSDALPGRAGYASPVIINVDGDDHVVMISATNSSSRGRRGRDSNEDQQQDPSNLGAVIGYDPATGKELWNYKGWQCRIPIPNMVEIGDGRYFITGGYEAGCAMIRIDKEGDEFVVKELYKNSDFGTHCHPPLLIDGYLYGHCSTNETKDGLVCMSLDGTIKWKTGTEPLFDKGGLMFADGRIYSVDGHEGYVYMIQPSPEGFKPISKAKLLGGREIWAPLTLVDGKLIVRDQEQMKCLLVK